MNKLIINSNDKTIIIGKCIEKSKKIYQILMGVIAMFELILFIRGILFFSMNSYKHYVYLYSYVFLFVASVCALIYLSFCKIKSNKYKTCNMVIYAYVCAIVLWSVVISFLDFKSGNFPIVYLTVIVTIASIIVLDIRFYLILTCVSFATLIAADGLCGFTYFVSSGEYINFIVLLAMAVFINFRLFNASVKEYYANETLKASVLEERNRVSTISLQTIKSIINTVDAKDKYTRAHSQRVSEYCTIIAKELGWDSEQVTTLREIALLHDIGKIGVPDSILNCPSSLSDEEYEQMKQHTVIGGEILKDLTILPHVSLGAKYHHERYDGNGYPSGLKGKDIPIEARIISVADAFDAMSSTRVYRKRLSNEKILSELENGKGKQFDAEIVDAFLPHAAKILNEKSEASD